MNIIKQDMEAQLSSDIKFVDIDKTEEVLIFRNLLSRHIL